ncbi:hypothetical protein O181_021740 [Austropuccinia psidii MF-1]|uniref:CCHC-type domain-containing protein n=1 Tax=Austropuccinia psidii MF-1 TaxID=1389203 RepID=A0A9Q3CG77_9BASI|nr:hypothetical protein [Austropuccinia psidii MF-1]
MSYSEKEALKQLPEASSWPKFSGTGEYNHMELIDHIEGLFIDVTSIPDCWITARLYTAFKGHANPYEWCLRQSKRLKAIDPQMNIQMRNHKLLTQIPGELEHAVKCRRNHNCTLDEISNTLQDVRKRTNIGKYIPYKSSGFKEKKPFRVEFIDKSRERVAEVAKKKNSCHTCGSTDHYANNCPRTKKRSMPLRKSQSRNPQQRNMTQTQWEIPS